MRHIGVEHVTIHFHASASLLFPRSLERLIAKFGGEKIVYDPTQSLSRAQALVTASHAVRAALGHLVRGLYYAPQLRTFYVSLETARVAAGEKLKVAELARIEQAVLKSVGAAFSPAAGDCP
ncbi:MAG: hypothetical protein K8S25_12665, partial [Alphaproteobacteria bacterium]|nr:hypothetical protein [Alphaproteobacteria bacterium]